MMEILRIKVKEYNRENSIRDISSLTQLEM